MQMRNRIATASTVTCRNMTFAITANTISVAVIGDCSVPTKTCITIWENFPIHHANDMKGEPMDLIDRQAAIDACIRVRELRAYDEIEEIKALPSAQPETPCYLGSPCEYQNPDVVISQPEPSIPLSWIEEHIEWLKSLDNEFANLAAAHISVMVKKWRGEHDDSV